MKELHEHNREIIDFHIRKETFPQKTGIKCPECGEELVFRSCRIETATSFPERRVFCQKCPFWGFMVV